MGCFIACFRSSKNRKSRTHISPNHQIHEHFEFDAKSIFGPVSQAVDVNEKQSNGSIETKVQFYPDANYSKEEVQNHPVEIEKEKDVELVKDDTENQQVLKFSEENCEKNKEKEENQIQSDSVNQHVLKFSQENCQKNKEKEENQIQSDSSMSSMISYPPMHRYHNCTISGDDEFEESSESLFSLSIESRKQVNITETEEPEEKDEVSSPFTIPKPQNLDTNSVKLNENGDGSKHVRSILSPVENLNQWKAVKSRIDQPTVDHTHEEKENIGLEFCEEPSLKLSSNHNPNRKFSNLKPKPQEPVVDASLSTWLVGSAINTPVSSEDSVESRKERRVLGEIKQLSTCSRKKSPTCSGGEVAIIGTVRSYLDHTGQTIDSCSRSSRKDNSGSPTKFKMDKGVECSSTPFARRLQRSLDTEIA